MKSPAGSRVMSSLFRYFGLILLFGLFFIIVALYLGTSPIWDSGSYFVCVERAASGSVFNLLNYRCFGHSSIIYFFYLALGQHLSPGNISLTYLQNAFLALAAAVAFYRLLNRLFADKLYETERVLLTGLFVFTPVFFAHLFHLNLDFGLVCFFVIFLAFLLCHRLWSAALFGTAMVFTKETGIPLYLSAIAVYALVFLAPKIRSQGKTWTFKQFFLLLVPVIITGFYFLILHLSRIDLFWTDATHVPLSAYLNINPLDPKIQTFLVDIFVLNFQWLLSLVITLIFAECLFKLISEKNRSAFSCKNREWIFILLLFLPVIFITTRFRVWNNPRYVLSAYPLLLLIFSGALASIRIQPSVRISILSGVFILIFFSNFVTIDPLSKAFFGTFRFGDYPILNMTRYIPNRSLGRDEMVYNLEFTNFQPLIADLTGDIKPSRDTVFFVAPYGSFFFPHPLDPVSRRPTVKLYQAEYLFTPQVFDNTPSFIRSLKNTPVFYYISEPNMLNDRPIALLRSNFPLIRNKIYSRNGYEIQLLTFSNPQGEKSYENLPSIHR